jgi:hypothetical protein
MVQRLTYLPIIRPAFDQHAKTFYQKHLPQIQRLFGSAFEGFNNPPILGEKHLNFVSNKENNCFIHLVYGGGGEDSWVYAECQQIRKYSTKSNG